MPGVPTRRGAAGHAQRRRGAAWGSEVSPCRLLQDQLVQREIGHRLASALVLALQLLEPLGLIQLQPAELGAPAVVGLLRDGVLAPGLGDGAPFATATSIARSMPMICSGVCRFPRAIPSSS